MSGFIPTLRGDCLTPVRRYDSWSSHVPSALAAQGLGCGGGAMIDGLDRVRCVLRAALEPAAIAGRPLLAGADVPVGITWRERIAASTDARDRPTQAPDSGPTGASAGPGLGSGPDPEEVEEAVALLVSRAQSGDPEAFGALYDRYIDLIYRYIYYRVGDRTLAEDLTSETFVRALRRISTFSWQGRDIGAWLVTIARNLVADHYKSARVRLEMPTADLLGAGADRPAAGPEGEVLDSMNNAALLDSVRQLGGDQQECVVLRFLEGLSVHETALAMGRKEGAVKALQYRAIRSLARLLPAGFVP
jgi:RNA polymerase sigma-70 factor (ECF subfamily)